MPVLVPWVFTTTLRGGTVFTPGLQLQKLRGSEVQNLIALPARGRAGTWTQASCSSHHTRLPQDDIHHRLHGSRCTDLGSTGTTPYGTGVLSDHMPPHARGHWCTERCRDFAKVTTSPSQHQAPVSTSEDCNKGRRRFYCQGTGFSPQKGETQGKGDGSGHPELRQAHRSFCAPHSSVSQDHHCLLSIAHSRASGSMK